LAQAISAQTRIFAAGFVALSLAPQIAAQGSSRGLLGSKAAIMTSTESASQPLKNPEGWGSIEEVVNAPLIDVSQDAWWISVIGMWFFIVINLIQAVFAGLCGCIFVTISIGTCCIPCSDRCCSAMGSVLAGRPLYMAWTWWRYVLAGLIALLRNGASRLALFEWEWRAFGSGDWWWHGEGVWCWSYKDCKRILQSQQVRKSAFGCINACIPDLFATNLLIFLSNDGSSDSEWAAIRRALHEFFIPISGDDPSKGDYDSRVAELPNKIKADVPSPKFEDLNDTTLMQKLVAKSVFYIMFGEWLDDTDALTLTGWRTNATAFILPRLVQRFLFNLRINKVKALRVGTVGIVESKGMQDVFVRMNNSLGRWKRTQDVKLCDEIMYVIGFAGIGGTSACVESCACFLQNKIPKESYRDAINFGQYSTQDAMIAAYKNNKDAYIQETCRLDPPVTSATGVLKAMTTVKLAGRDYEMPAGILNQYVVSMANRDSTVFKEPTVFKPDRSNLTQAFTWNGAAFSSEEGEYPRICPGRYLSLTIAKAIIDHFLGLGAK